MSDLLPVNVGDWIIRRDSYGFAIGVVAKVTKKTVSYRRDGMCSEWRADRANVVFVGDEAAVRACMDKIKSAEGERNRRQSEARLWFDKRVAEIVKPEVAHD